MVIRAVLLKLAAVADPPVSPTTSMPDGVCHDEQQIPSLHTIIQAAEAWNNIRSDLLRALSN